MSSHAATPVTASNWHYRRAVDVLHAGGVLAYPTESVWGLGCDPLNESAVGRLLEVKGRAMAKGLILIAGSPAELSPFVSLDDPADWQKLQASTEAKPVTWIVPTAANVPGWITGGRSTIAVRVSAFAPVQELCRRFGGALVSTSANRSGKNALRDGYRVRSTFGGELDDVLPGTVGRALRPSVIKCLASGATLRS